MIPAPHLVLGFMPHGTDWIWIALVALLLFGRRLPEVMRGLGGSVREFKKGMDTSPSPSSDANPYATPPPAAPRVEGAVPRDATQGAQPPAQAPAAPPAQPAPPANGQPHRANRWSDERSWPAPPAPFLPRPP